MHYSILSHNLTNSPPPVCETSHSMAFGFLNFVMLAGLLGVTLPVLAHLLSKRRFDVVEWGAMQFLQMGHKTKRRIRIQDWLLLLLRMGLIALIAIALSRPWGQGSLFGHFKTAPSRDLVFIVDGSASMDWQENANTPHKKAIQWVYDALETLQPGDTATLIDARAQARFVIETPSSDFKAIRDELSKLPSPTGTSNLAEAITEAMKLLMTTNNVSREIIVLTDGQALPWHLEDLFAWERIDDLKRQPEIPPVIGVVNLGTSGIEKNNFSVDRIALSREFTVPNFPIRLRTTIRQSGGSTIERKVYFEIDGQRFEAKTMDVSLLKDGEALVEFEHFFPNKGTYLASIIIEDDQMLSDNKSDAVIIVDDGIPVLLVDGDPNVDPTKSESFFAKSVFAASGEKTPWVRTTIISPEELSTKTLLDQRVVFLMNVNRLKSDQVTSLANYVADGGGLVIAPGDQVDPKSWNPLSTINELPFVPATFEELKHEERNAKEPTTVDHLTLETPWLSRFRKESGVDLWQTRYSDWWSLKPFADATLVPEGNAEVPEEGHTIEDASVTKIVSTKPIVLAKLSNGAPLLISRRYEKGTIYQLAAPLDADWSTLPSKNDFVPFLHEMVFVLAVSDSRRNVDVGAPLLLPLKDQQQASNFAVNGPILQDQPARTNLESRTPTARYNDTTLPGLYTFRSLVNLNQAPEPFVVADDRKESNLKPLTEGDLALLAQNARTQQIETMNNLSTTQLAAQTRTELWWLILLFVLGLLVAEVALTRKMVKGGHTALDMVPESA